MDPSEERTSSYMLGKGKRNNVESCGRSKHVANKRKCDESDDTTQCTYLDIVPDGAMGVIMKFLLFVDLMNLCKAVPSVQSTANNPKLWNHVHVDMWAIRGGNLISMMWPHRKYITSLTMECTENRVMRRTRSVRIADPVDERLVERLKSFRQLQNVRMEGAVLPSTLLLKLPKTVKTLKLIRCSMPYEPNNQVFDLASFQRIVDRIYVREINMQQAMFMENLHIHDCQPLWFQLKGRTLPFLRTLHFTDTTSWVDIQTLGYMLLTGSFRDTLQEIDISKADIRDTDSVSEVGVLNTVENAFEIMFISFIDVQLRVIRAGHRNDIDDEFMRVIMLHRSLFRQSLEELHLNSCSQLTDDALDYIPNGSRLTLLNLEGCTGISDGAVDNFIVKCPNLRVIR